MLLGRRHSRHQRERPAEQHLHPDVEHYHFQPSRPLNHSQRLESWLALTESKYLTFIADFSSNVAIAAHAAGKNRRSRHKMMRMAIALSGRLFPM